MYAGGRRRRQSGWCWRVAGLLAGGLDAAARRVAAARHRARHGAARAGWIRQLPGLRVILPVLRLAAGGAAADPGDRRGARWLSTRRGCGARGSPVALVLAGVAVRLRWSAITPHSDVRPLRVRAAATGARAASGAAWLLAGPLVATAVGVGAAMRTRRRAGAGAGRWSRRAAVVELLLLWRAVLPQPRSRGARGRRRRRRAFLQPAARRRTRASSACRDASGYRSRPMLFGLRRRARHLGAAGRRFQDYLRAIDRRRQSACTLQQLAHRARALLDLAAVRFVAVGGRHAVSAAADCSAAIRACSLVYADDVSRDLREPRRAAARAHRASHRSGRRRAPRRGPPLLALASRATRRRGRRSPPRSASSPTPPAARRRRRSTADRARDEWVRIVDAGDPDALVLEARARRARLGGDRRHVLPGLAATVDGEPAPIFPADLLFRAVSVPAGRHTIALRYGRASFRWGWLVAVPPSSASCCLVGTQGRAPLRRRRAGGQFGDGADEAARARRCVIR